MNAITLPSSRAHTTSSTTPTTLKSWSAPRVPACARPSGICAAGSKTACITKVFPTRSHTVAAQGGSARPQGNMGARTTGAGTCSSTVKGSDWLGDQDAIEYMCREAIPAVYELEHFGVPFSCTDAGKIYQRPFGGHMTDYGDGSPAMRACAAADRTGHAILHTLYQQSLKHEVETFIRIFRPRPDRPDDEGVCRAA